MLDGVDYTLERMMTEPFTDATKKKKNKRKFSDEQIKSLELMFDSETRLESEKKIEVAKQLGLHPRQVAIWFQNKRARWKSKQLQRDYTILQQNYSTLASKLESLIKEKQALVIQLQKLNDLLEKQKEEGEAMKSDSEGQLSLPMEKSEHAHVDDDSDRKIEYLGVEEEVNFLSMVEPADGSLTSPEDWRSFDSDGLFGYQCWDYWS